MKRVYAQGSGQDCRKHVQKLNMRSGDLQMTKGLTLLNDSDENSVAENPSCSSEDEDRRHVAKPSLHLKESKWNKFMDVSSGNRNDEQEFDDFDVTTVKEVSGKAVCRGKRKLAKQAVSLDHCHNEKRFKNISNNNAENMLGSKKRVSQSPRDLGSQEQNIRSQLSNPENVQNRCNLYFAKATRDPAPDNKDSLNSIENKAASYSNASKWTKYLPILMSSEPEETSSQLTFATPGFVEYTRLPSEAGSGRSQTYCNVPLADGLGDCVSNSLQAGSLHAKNLFNVEDDLEEGWWNRI